MYKLLFLTIAIAAADLSHAAGNTPTGKISLLNIGELIQVELVDGNENKISLNPDGCSNDTDTYLLVKEGNDNFEAVFRGLILAKGINADVKLWLDGCYTQENGKVRSQIKSVNIR